MQASRCDPVGVIQDLRQIALGIADECDRMAGERGRAADQREIEPARSISPSEQTRGPLAPRWGQPGRRIVSMTLRLNISVDGGASTEMV